MLRYIPTNANASAGRSADVRVSADGLTLEAARGDGAEGHISMTPGMSKPRVSLMGLPPLRL
jgi:hypothetical protein